MDFLKRYRKMISLRGLTEHTIKSYSTYISAYLDYICDRLHKYPSQVTWNEIRNFIEWIQKERGLSDRTINHCISQIRFFTLYVLHKPWDPYQVPMRKFDNYMPYVPSQKETMMFIDSFTNLKHKAILSLMYSAGLRVGEVCQLHYEDISRTNMRIHIRKSKNRSDRYAILSQHALAILTDYWRANGRPMGYLFPNRNNHQKPMATYTVNQFIYAREETLGWNHKLTCHGFRHAFGTHLYENGIDLLTIQKLMGHRSLHSSMIYVQLAPYTALAVKSPFDLFGGGSDG